MADIEKAKIILLELLQNRGPDKTICPSEVARSLVQADWRDTMPLVRQAAELLRIEGKLRIEQQGIVVDPATARGPVRYRWLDEAGPNPPEPAYLGGPKFTAEEIEQAREMKRLGLSWLPRPGQYVWDEHALIEKTSPFQPQVYFILDLKHFLRRAGSIERLQELLVWLPTWEEMRVLLDRFGFGVEVVAQHLQETRSLETGNERSALYHLALSALRNRASG